MNISIPPETIGCIILSGGFSSRMQRHKALLPFNDRANFLEHIIEIYSNAGIPTAAVINSEIMVKQNFTSSATMIYNNFPEKGRLYSMQLGLTALPNVNYCFIQNVDNPFVATELLKKLYRARTYADYISPEYGQRGGHPILVSRPIMDNILATDSYNLTFHDLLSGFSRHRVAANDDRCLVNINDRSDYLYYFGNKSAAND